MSKHRKRSLAHDAVYAKEAVVDWLAAAAEGRHDPTIQYFQGWRDMSFQMGASAATMPRDMTVPELVDRIGFVAAHSETWFVSSDVSALVMDASTDMPPHSMRREDLPTHSGWLYFETPLETLATDGSYYKIRAILWQQRAIVGDTRRRQAEMPGLVMWCFSDIEDMTASTTTVERMGPSYAEEVTESIRVAFAGRTPLIPVTFGVIGNGRIPWVAMKLSDDGVPEEAPVIPSADTWVAKNVYLEKAFQDFYARDSWDDGDAPIPVGEIEKDGSEDGRWVVRTPNGERVLIYPDPSDRWFLAFLRFIQQKLPAIHQEPVAKSVAKKLRNKGMPAGPITVVTWRKRERTPETGTGSPLTYRYVRRGHWRRVWCGPLDGERYQKPVLIAPTIVGDPSLPLRIREVSNAVVR